MNPARQICLATYLDDMLAEKGSVLEFIIEPRFPARGSGGRG